ncbi:MAG: 2-polyprenyl-3-methyl-6-methoxy-1,4-benzoquinone monooxygenase [Gammaproteobacteria bacterium]
MNRHYTFVDRTIMAAERAVGTVSGRIAGSGRPPPPMPGPPPELSRAEHRHSCGLMRVNDAGEIAAQGLYHGQSLTAPSDALKNQLEDAAAEEGDHLHWCRDRLDTLGGRPSVLNPLWYAGAFAMGAVASLAGERVSLGFLAETERQVVAHLDDHLARLPEADTHSRAVLERMREEEGRHEHGAREAGAADLPRPVTAMMALVSRFMTRGAYYL